MYYVYLCTQWLWYDKLCLPQTSYPTVVQQFAQTSSCDCVLHCVVHE